MTSATTEPRRWRSILSGILIVTALVLTPVAAFASWGRVQLVDTDRFVATFAPLANDPAVQELIADEATDAILAKLDIEAMVGELFDGTGSITLPPGAIIALQSLAVQGVESLVGNATTRVVASPAFARTFETALRVTHHRTTSLIQGGDAGLVNLDDDGVIAIDVGFVVDEVRASLTERGVALARFIPEVSRSIPLVQADALTLVRTAYNTAAAVGYWLPLLVLALMGAGIALALDRRRALVRTGIATAIVLGVVLVGIAIGGMVIVGALRALFIPPDAITAIYNQVTADLRATLIALLVLSALVAIAAWLTGTSGRATAARTTLERGFASTRTVADDRGLGTGAFGIVVQRWRGVILTLGLALTISGLLLLRPITFWGVVGIVAAFLVFAVAVEVLRRPEVTTPEPAAPIASAARKSTATKA